ncbi:cold-shock protein [Bizionia sp. KMM 8389]
MLKKWINKLFGKETTKTTSTVQKNTTKEGTVKFYNKSKKFGFIIVDGTDEEIFVHASNLKDKIRKKDKVTFGLEQSDRGLVAINVRRIPKN